MSGTNVFQNCTGVTLADLGSLTKIRNSSFVGANNLATIIMRKSSDIVALENVSAFNSSPFRSGGSGGTIYIPKVLFDELGTGSSLGYKVATNWSTVEGYGTITWAQLEGSPYESLDWWEDET